MSIETELNDYVKYLGSAYDKCYDKGAVIPTKKNLKNLTDCIDSISGDPTDVDDFNPPIPDGTEYLFHFDDNSANEFDSSLIFDRGTLTSSPAKFGNAYRPTEHLENSYTSIVLSSVIPSTTELERGRIIDEETGERSAPLDMTIEFWIYTKGGSENNHLQYGNGAIAQNFIGLEVYLSGTRVGASFGNNSSLNPSSTSIYYNHNQTLLNTWVHIAVVFNTGVMTLFVNGVKIGSKELTGIATTGGRRLVLSGNGTASSTAYFDELVISTEALYTTDFIPPEFPYGGKKVLDRLYVYKPPTKTVYESGEYFDISGAKIMAEYTTGAVTDVTEDCVVLETDPITTDTKYRTVSYTYRGITKTVYINVGAYTIEPTLDLSTAKLLMNFDSNVLDLTGLNTPVVTGNDLYGEGMFGHARYFNGSTDYISMPYTDDLNIDTGDFTIAFWFYGFTSTSNGGIFSLQDSTNGLRVIAGSNGTLYGVVNYTSGDTVSSVSVGDFTYERNAWQHYAVVRKGDVVKSYLNGKVKTTNNISGSLVNGANLIIGARISGSNKNYFNGYVDDLIITKSALWTNEFTPPSRSLLQEGITGLDIPKILAGLVLVNEPTKTMYKVGETFSLEGTKIMASYTVGEDEDVTAACEIIGDTVINEETESFVVSFTHEGITKEVIIYVWVYEEKTNEELDLSKTKLLMNFDGNTTDLMGINTPTVVGNDLYGEGKFGQARYFNGTTDCIKMPYTDDISIDTGDFTIAFWTKAVTCNATTLIITNFITSYGWRIYLGKSKKITARFSTNTSDSTMWLESSTLIDLNTWYHVAFVRKGNNLSLYLDGKLVDSEVYDGNFVGGTTLMLGSWKSTPADFYNGYIDDLIITKTALWDGEFTPPCQPYSATSRVSEMALYELNDGGGVE